MLLNFQYFRDMGTRWSITGIVVAMILLAPVYAAGKLPLSVTGRVSVIIEPVYKGQPLQLTDQYYINGHGDTLYIDLFRFYMTHFRLASTTPGKQPVSCANSNHLVDAERPASLQFYLDATAGDYNSISFTAGVDSTDNTSGANSGDLDPVKGMYWAWNSGYIMAKLEGHSAVCATFHNAFEYHIGGYMPPYNAARTIIITLPETTEKDKDGNTVLRIQADAAAWFTGIDLAKVNNIVIPGKDAAMMADNYANMFSLKK